MRQLLLDTHVLIWWLTDSPMLGKIAKQEIANPANKVYVSAISSWEISIKKAIGKLMAPDNISQIVEQKGFIELPIHLSHGDAAGLLPAYHNDPFDRMLIAQAQTEGMILVTKDRAIFQYNIQVLNALD